MRQHTFFVLVIAVVFSMSVEARAYQREQTQCTPAELSSSSLTGGMYAEVIAEEPLIIRDDPSTDSESKGVLEPGATVFILSDVQCQEGFLWWQVELAPIQWRKNKRQVY